MESPRRALVKVVDGATMVRMEKLKRQFQVASAMGGVASGHRSRNSIEPSLQSKGNDMAIDSMVALGLATAFFVGIASYSSGN